MEQKKNTTNLTGDSLLWSKLKTGDEKAFSVLFKKHYEHLVRYGNSFSNHPEKIQDCVQDVFTDIWIYKHSLNDNDNVKAYLLSSVRKRFSRLQAKDRIFNKIAPADATNFLFEFSIEHQLISDEITAHKVMQLNKLINLLPSRQKEALYLRYYQGLSVGQMADILEVNCQSANNLLHRALLNLRKNELLSIFLFLMR
ncbi:sigma-70 family RNA polymerase sigma factor [Flavobacterium piscis]|uniref:RNA polymerase sigma factor (Sigma-70 family) n=1 Tax=Flavobacterium piscis TaxID=1114874 RepID=A0ABU1Y6X6_9FLAO|nr:sigma-70 family RNA polymerase sigma factor [Flavobacterium piscis]MDR7209380.1 RNA polymerase sigma factor (sigma-70 family) [Flavobacterium piscis]